MIEIEKNRQSQCGGLLGCFGCDTYCEEYICIRGIGTLICLCDECADEIKKFLNEN